MREALRINLAGVIVDVALVPAELTELQAITEPNPEDPEAVVVVGYLTTARVPEGTYKAVFDFEAGVFVEGLTQEEIDEIRNVPQLPTELDILGEQLVQRELETLELRSENQMLGEQIVALELRLLALEGSASA